jgi:hypothetical protein
LRAGRQLCLAVVHSTLTAALEGRGVARGGGGIALTWRARQKSAIMARVCTAAEAGQRAMAATAAPTAPASPASARNSPSY